MKSIVTDAALCIY